MADDADHSEPGIEPGTPTPENIAFVVLGVLSTFAVIVHLALLLGSP